MKKITFNFIFFVIVLTVLEVMVFMFYAMDFSARRKASVYEGMTANVQAAKDDFNERLERGFARLDSIPEADLMPLPAGMLPDGTVMPEGCAGWAVYTGDGTTGTMNVILGGKSYEYSFKDKSKVPALSTNALVIATAWQLTTEGNSAATPTYAVFSRETATGRQMIITDASLLFDDNYTYGFRQLLVLGTDGVVLTDNTGNTDMATVRELLVPDGTVTIGDDEVARLEFEVPGSEKLVLAGYKSAADLHKEIRQGIVRLALIGVALVALGVAVAVLYTQFFVKRHNEMVRMGKVQSSYVAEVDKFGKIIKANTVFAEEFEVEELFDKICDLGKTTEEILEGGLPMTVVLKDKTDRDRFITFYPRKQGEGYQLTGDEVPATARNMDRNVALFNKDDHLDMFTRKKLKADFEAAHEALRSTDGLLMLLELKNIEKYRVMFGEQFYADTLLKYSELIRDKFRTYGELYYLSHETFAMLIIGSERAHQFTAKGADLVKELNKPVAIADNLIKLDCVAGVVQIQKLVKQNTFEEVHAFAALAVDKSIEQKTTFSVYEASKSSYVITFSKKKEMVRSILENNEVEIYFQPQFSLKDKKIVGFESLSRISGTHAKVINIGEFIEVAEQSGYMIKLGEYVFERAMRFAKSVQDYNISVSLNVSPVQLLQSGFVKAFLDKYQSYNLNPGSICVEITETFLMTTMNEVMEKLEMLKQNGISIHLDDFGVGYSSMLYLKKLPADTIKLDKEFVADIAENEYSRVICGKIIDITKELKMMSIAEGVESQPQVDVLEKLKCDIIQGYYIGPAVSDVEAKNMILEYNTRGKIHE